MALDDMMHAPSMALDDTMRTPSFPVPHQPTRLLVKNIKKKKKEQTMMNSCQPPPTRPRDRGFNIPKTPVSWVSPT